MYKRQNIYNANLFEQLHTLSHVLLTEHEGGSIKTSQNPQGTKKNIVADVESYPVQVGKGRGNKD